MDFEKEKTKDLLEIYNQILDYEKYINDLKNEIEEQEKENNKENDN